MSFAKKRVLVKQHLDGKWSVWLGGEQIACHNATEFKEPIRSYKHKQTKSCSSIKHAIQVYIASKPAKPSYLNYTVNTP